MLDNLLSHTRGLYPSQYEGTIVDIPGRTVKKYKYSNPYKVAVSTQQILSTILLLLLISPWGSCNLKIVSAFIYLFIFLNVLFIFETGRDRA